MGQRNKLKIFFNSNISQHGEIINSSISQQGEIINSTFFNKVELLNSSISKHHFHFMSMTSHCDVTIIKSVGHKVAIKDNQKYFSIILTLLLFVSYKLYVFTFDLFSVCYCNINIKTLQLFCF